MGCSTIGIYVMFVIVFIVVAVIVGKNESHYCGISVSQRSQYCGLTVSPTTFNASVAVVIFISANAACVKELC